MSATREQSKPGPAGSRWTAEPVAVGLVGAGPWARVMHARMLSQGPETRLAGIWARNRDAARRTRI